MRALNANILRTKLPSVFFCCQISCRIVTTHGNIFNEICTNKGRFTVPKSELDRRERFVILFWIFVLFFICMRHANTKTEGVSAQIWEGCIEPSWSSHCAGYSLQFKFKVNGDLNFRFSTLVFLPLINSYFTQRILFQHLTLCVSFSF